MTPACGAVLRLRPGAAGWAAGGPVRPPQAALAASTRTARAPAPATNRVSHAPLIELRCHLDAAAAVTVACPGQTSPASPTDNPVIARRHSLEETFPGCARIADGRMTQPAEQADLCPSSTGVRNH